jgi:hypothetical protein
MPKEVRYILFSPEEVHAALLSHVGERGWGPTEAPSQRGLRSELVAAPCGGVAARLLRSGQTVPAPEAYKLGTSDLLAAILAFCRAVHVPLPVNGQKALELINGRLAMTVTLNSEPVFVEAETGVLRYTDSQTEALRHRAHA